MPADSGFATPPTKTASNLAVDLALLFMVTVWAGNVVVLKILLRTFGPAALSGLRFGLLSIVGLGVLAVSGGPWSVARGDVPRLIASALSGITLAQILFMQGLHLTSAFASNVLQGTEPLFLLILVWTTRAEAVTRRQGVGLLTAFAGTIVFFLQDARGQAVLTVGMGEVLNLLSALAFAVYAYVSRPLFVRYPGRTVMALTLSVGALPLVLLAAPSVFRLDFGSIPYLAWLGVVGSAVFAVYFGYWIWNWAIRQKGLTHTSLYLFLDVVLSGFFTYLFLGERFGPWRLLGTGVILTGLHFARKP